MNIRILCHHLIDFVQSLKLELVTCRHLIVYDNELF
jgi:hypothetical protein